MEKIFCLVQFDVVRKVIYEPASSLTIVPGLLDCFLCRFHSISHDCYISICPNKGQSSWLARLPRLRLLRISQTPWRLTTRCVQRSCPNGGSSLTYTFASFQLNENDSSYGDELSTYTASLTSSVKNFEVEHGRKFHAFRDHVKSLLLPTCSVFWAHS